MRKKQILKSILSVILCLAMVLPSNLAMSAPETVQAAPIISDTNLLVNGSFADEDGDGKADGWQYFKGSVTEAASTIGEDGITVECDSTNENQRLTLHQTVSLPAGKYVFKGMVQAPAVSKGGVRVYETVTGGARNKFYETLKPVAEWTPFEQEIIVEKDGDTIKVELEITQGAVCTAKAKDFVLARVYEGKEYLVNGSFADEDGDGKADGWQYFKGSVTEAASTIGEDGITVECDSTNENQRLTVHQTVSLPAGTYVFTGKVQAPAVSKGGVRVYQTVTGGSRDKFYESLKPVEEWTTFEKEIVVEKDGDTIKVELEITQGAVCTVKAKDFSLIKVFTGNEGKEYLVNGTFADADANGKADNWEYFKGSVTEAASSIGEDGITVECDSTNENQRLTVHQTAKDLPAGTYMFTGKVQAPAVSKGGVRVYQTVTGGARDKFYETLKPVEEWTTFEKEIVVEKDGDTIKVELEITQGAVCTAKAKDFSLVLIAEAPEPEENNLLANPAYEDADNDGKADSWNYYSNKGADANYESSSKDGVFTAKMNGTGTLVLHQTVKLGAEGLNKKYTFSGEMKATDLTGSYASFRIQLVDAAGKGLGMKESDRTNTATSEWIPVVIEFEVPEESTGAAVAGFKVEHYINAGTGTVEFRNVKVLETGVMENIPEGDPIDTLIFNGGYEKTATGFPASWSLWESTGGLKASSDRTVKYEGYSSLHIEEKKEGQNSRGSIHQTFTVTDELKYLTGNSIKMSQWIKTEGFSGTGLSIRIHDPANTLGTGSVVANKTIPVAATQDWTLYEYTLELPSYPLKTIKVEYLYDGCQGDVWIDNTRVSGYVRATGIEVEAEPFVLQVGEEHQLKLNFVPQNATIQEVVFANSNDSVISVDKEGLIKALKNGTSVITITQEEGIKKEVAVLVCDNELKYDETIAVATKQNVKQLGTLPKGYTYAVAAAAQHGTFLVENGNEYLYYPDKDYVGEDSVTLIVTKGGLQTLVTVSLKVESVNAAPNCADFNVLTNVNETVSGKVVVTDPENDEVTFEVVVKPQHGTFTMEGETYTYVPEQGYDGYDSAIIHAKDATNVTEVEAMIFVAASVEDILATVKNEHSRLLADNARFEEIKELIKTDENAKLWFEAVKAELDALLSDTTPVPFECPDGLRLNTQGSKDVLNMAFMYRVTGDMAYYERACLELDSLCNIYPDWNPVHLLDTAMTANGVAIAYDWLYDALKENDPKLLEDVEKALYTFGLEEAKKQFEANHMFVTNLNNWNYVCNGGFATTALALAHHENEAYHALAGEILQRCYKSIQYGLPQYAPEGDSIEGISYWDYGTRYLVSCLASISSATNVENPFISAPGLYETAQYPIYMTGKAGTYNYSDNDMTPSWGYINLWLANEFDEPSYTWYHKDYVANNGALSVYDLLYYYPEQYEADAPDNLDRYYTSQAVTTMRHDFETDPSSSFLGFKGGTNGAAHGDLDIGSFVYDIYGIRWAFDFGKEDYNLPGYWELVETGTRWNYYRKNALGHNTLVINPENGGNQTVGAYVGAIEQSINNPGGGYTILDMTDAYQKNAVDVKRGFAYINRTQVLIRDEFTLKEASEIYWQMHTEAEVTVSKDGKTATLTKDGKTIELRLFDENGSNYKFATMAAVAYEGVPTAEGEDPNVGITKIYIKATDVQKGTFNVLITPVGGANPEILALEDWDNYDFSAAQGKTKDGRKVFAGETVYTVKKGDNLWIIAKRLLGNGEKYTELFARNNDIIEKETLIFPGQEIIVPAK